MDSKRERWEAFLDPDVLRGKLISASIYIAAYELLKGSIVERIESFFSTDFNQEGRLTSPEYDMEVLSRNRSQLYASLDWLRENDVIDDADLAAFETIKAYRNQLAHEMSGLIAGSTNIAYLEQLPIMAALLKKIETWWIVNVEIPINPDFAEAEIDESGIVPGPSISLQLMIDIALGDADASTVYLHEFRKRWPQSDDEKT